MKTIEIKEIFESPHQSSLVTIKGWVKSNRDSGKIAFLEINDGTTINNIQVVYKKLTTTGFDTVISARTGSAVLAVGEIKTNNKAEQKYELVAKEVKLLKQAHEDYPLQKKQHSLEFLRDHAHLRARTTTFASIMRVRSRLAYIIHKFFQDNGFIWVASPIITSNDAEGAGENFELINGTPSKTFFDKTAKLTVSGQLNAEAYAQAFSQVYTFGPTFRAEYSHTNRHIAEFWMIEPEIAFIDLNQLMLVIETFIKTIVKDITKQCNDEINFFTKNNPEIQQRLNTLIKDKFNKVEYQEVINLLQTAVKKDHKFENNDIHFGMDLASEHERYICEKIYNSPVFIFNYPKEIKAFYMKVNSDNKTVAACDLLVPGVGEIIGGSQREDDYDTLLNRCQELHIDLKNIQWYLDLRKYGYHSSAGFGLGFERLLMYLLNLDNIRDAIPFPRSPGSLKF
ncbi:MAG: asparagine--tRNA ligase [Mycoplasmataceae bacterium]|nr:asparagine--tRNA ligase [Mycoplasmataceae bacterium]